MLKVNLVINAKIGMIAVMSGIVLGMAPDAKVNLVFEVDLRHK